MMTGNWMVAVSYLEWIRWVATGRLRCAGRVRWVGGVTDRAGFDAMIESAPDLDFEDDQAFVLAKLDPREVSASPPLRAGAGLDERWLMMDGVSSFHPLTQRGGALLEADAERAGVCFGPPDFEPLWEQWRIRQLEERAEARSRMFRCALGLPESAIVGFPRRIHDVLTGISSAESETKADPHKGSSAYAWALAFGQARAEVSKGGWEVVDERFRLKSLLASMKHSYQSALPVMRSPAVSAGWALTENLPESLKALPVPAFAVAMHYRHLLLSDRRWELDALLDDLVELGVAGGAELAAATAHYVSLAMPNSMVTTLLYQSSSEKFPAIRPGASHLNLQIGRRIEEAKVADSAQKQPVIVAATLDVSSLEASTEALVAGDGAEIQVESSFTTSEPTEALTPDGAPAHGSELVATSDITSNEAQPLDAKQSLLKEVQDTESATSMPLLVEASGESAQEQSGHPSVTETEGAPASNHELKGRNVGLGKESQLGLGIDS
jgi:hypothetical protein